MATSGPEKLPINLQKKVVKQLVQGQEFATQLQILLNKPYDIDGPNFTSQHQDQLVLNILASFAEALSLLGSGHGESVEVSQTLAPSQVGSVCCDDRRSEDSGESNKRPTTTTSTTKDRRGCYKRKKTSHSWTTVSSTLIQDGRAWRKYGQKEILNSKHPRSYFRCTHKYDQGCKAIKQVQKMEEDPQMFRTTYIGHHTCRDILQYFPQILTADSDHNYNPQESNNSDSSKIATVVVHHPIIKQEHNAETPSVSDVTDNLSPLESMMWKDFIATDEHELPTLPLRSDYRALSLDMDLVVKSIDFDASTDFHFDETEFLCKL